MLPVSDDPIQTLSTTMLAELRAWRAAHPRATFAEIETEVETRLAQVRAQWLQDTALSSPAREWTALPPDQQPRCPLCSTPLEPRGLHVRTLRSHHDQPVVLTRQYGSCPHCAAVGLFPLDDELALPSGQLTPLLHEWVVRLGALVPFLRVPALLAFFAGLSLSRETVRRQTEAAGALLVAADTAAAPALAPPAAPGADTADHLQLSADGAMVRLQNGTWVEVKTLAIGVVQPVRTAKGDVLAQTTELSYFSRHAPATEFIAAAVVETHRRGVRRAAAVGGVMDGARWLQGLLDYHRPDAVRILDLPHAAEHLGALAGAVWGEGSTQAREWQTAQVATLRTEGAGPVLAGIAELSATVPENSVVAEHAAYLRTREAQMAYPAFRAAGWPLGSGCVESANKVVVEARLKGAGMSWSTEALNPMLALRDAECNGRWAEAWRTVRAGQQTGWPGGAALGAAREEHPPTPAAADEGRVDPEVVAEVEAILARVAADMEEERAGRRPVNGTPGPRHPWRRATLSAVR